MSNNKKQFSLLDNAIRLYFANCDSLKDDNIFMKLYSELPVFRKNKVDNFYFKKDKYLSSAAWYILSYSLSQFGLDVNSYDIDYTKYGKPYLKDCPLKFNLSHSGSMVFCALSLEDIGCDVEHISDYDEKVAAYAFTDEEIDLLNTLNEANEKIQRFYSLWTIKESVIKYTALGLNINPRDINVVFGENYNDISVSIKIEPWNTRNFNIYKINIDKDYSWACCDGNMKKSITAEKVCF